MNRIGDYTLLRQCGRGAYGDVWLAQNRVGNRFALKILEPNVHAASEQKGLMDYSRITDSPYLVKIYHVGESDGRIFYTMELADDCGDGEGYCPKTLAAAIARAPFSASETASIGIKLLKGLADLHARQLIHRDIKPENIIFVNGEPKLSDVGLVRVLDRTVTLSGTLGFIPPERLSDLSQGMSKEDDLYALGKVLYCCFSGNPVEKFPSIPAHTLDQRHESHLLNQAILTACAQNDKQRFRSAEDFADALTQGVPLGKRLSKRWLSPKSILAAGMATFLVAGGIAGVRYFNGPAIDYGLMINPSEALSLPQRDYQVRNVLQDDDFADRNWEPCDLNGFGRNNGYLKFYSNATGALVLNRRLPEAYSISFDLNLSKLNGKIDFETAIVSPRGTSRTSFTWGFVGNNGRVTIQPLVFLAEDREIRKLPSQPVEVRSGLQHLEIIHQYESFSVYLDRKPLFKLPSLFSSGTFAIQIQAKKKNLVTLKRFELNALIPEENPLP